MKLLTKGSYGGLFVHLHHYAEYFLYGLMSGTAWLSEIFNVIEYEDIGNEAIRLLTYLCKVIRVVRLLILILVYAWCTRHVQVSQVYSELSKIRHEIAELLKEVPNVLEYLREEAKRRAERLREIIGKRETMLDS